MTHIQRAPLFLTLAASLLLSGCGDQKDTQAPAPASETKPTQAPADKKADAQPKLPVALDPKHPFNDENLSARASNAAASLLLSDSAKSERIKGMVLNYLQTLRSWFLQHPASDIPAGLNPLNGRPLSQADRDYIHASGTPLAFLRSFVDALGKELTPQQSETLFDTMTGFAVPKTKDRVKEIVPDLKPEEAIAINTVLSNARTRALLMLPPSQIKRHFEITLPQIKETLNKGGRDWDKLLAAAQARRAAEAGTPKPAPSQKQAPKR